ncbi:MxaL protein [Caldimonas sp. KR1-144]|uniref:MxaL protein n=1 Tax=Caldimonas sp. KR1-144 TaxID=3400911 RepID=UPI003C103716
MSLWHRLRGEPLLAAALALLLLACSLPPLPMPRRIGSYLVAFDITQSMEASDTALDAAPASRLVFAKAALEAALLHLPCGSRVGLAVFTDYRVLPVLAPLEVCAHYDALRSALDAIDGRMRWANASNIGKGIYWAQRGAQTLEPDLLPVFVTDGQEAPPLRDGESGAPPTPDGAPLLLVGVGGDQPVPIPRIDAEGRPIGFWRAEDVVQRSGIGALGSREELTRLDDGHLRSFTRRSGTAYVRLRSLQDLGAALLEARGATLAWVPTDVRALPAALALAMLVARALRRTRGRG